MKVYSYSGSALNFIFLFFLGLASCTQDSAVPFPENPSGYESPKYWLGLSRSYDIGKAHGGDLRVKSVEREGTEMIIFLPLEN